MSLISKVSSFHRMSITNKEIEGLSYVELKALLAKKREAEIDRVTKELTAARGIVASLEAQLVNLDVTAPAPAPTAPAAIIPAPAKRGPKPKGGSYVGNGKPAKTKKVKAQRGAVGEAITTFVSSKGKAGAHVSDIAAATGFKPANITAFFYAKANLKKFKKVAPATFATK